MDQFHPRCEPHCGSFHVILGSIETIACRTVVPNKGKKVLKIIAYTYFVLAGTYIFSLAFYCSFWIPLFWIALYSYTCLNSIVVMPTESKRGSELLPFLLVAFTQKHDEILLPHLSRLQKNIFCKCIESSPPRKQIPQILSMQWLTCYWSYNKEFSVKNSFKAGSRSGSICRLIYCSSALWVMGISGETNRHPRIGPIVLLFPQFWRFSIVFLIFRKFSWFLFVVATICVFLKLPTKSVSRGSTKSEKLGSNLFLLVFQKS